MFVVAHFNINGVAIDEPKTNDLTVDPDRMSSAALVPERMQRVAGHAARAPTEPLSAAIRL